MLSAKVVAYDLKAAIQRMSDNGSKVRIADLNTQVTKITARIGDGRSTPETDLPTDVIPTQYRRDADVANPAENRVYMGVNHRARCAQRARNARFVHGSA